MGEPLLDPSIDGNTPWVDLRRKGKVRIGEDQLRQLLELPTGTRVIAVQASCDPPSIVLVLQNNDWPVQPADVEAPYLHQLTKPRCGVNIGDSVPCRCLLPRGHSDLHVCEHSAQQDH